MSQSRRASGRTGCPARSRRPRIAATTLGLGVRDRRSSKPLSSSVDAEPLSLSSVSSAEDADEAAEADEADDAEDAEDADGMRVWGGWAGGRRRALP